MKLLLDTHLLIWAADGIERVPAGARALMADLENELLFHKDPFDRLLIAQAMVEGITLLTDDATVALYQGPVRLA